MSDRNTGLFLPGHVPASTVARAFLGLTKIPLDELRGPEAPRVGHGTRNGHPYTHVGLRLFEVAGLLLMDEDGIPAADEVEMHLGCALSEAVGKAVFAFYDEENAAGGAAVFEKGALVARECWDAREFQPVHRRLDQTVDVAKLDISEWVWKPSGDVIEAAMTPLVGPGIRTDDELVVLMEAAAAEALDLTATGAHKAAAGAAPAPKAPAPTASSAPRKRDRIKGLLGRFGRS